MKKLFIVDDENDIAEILKVHFTRKGFETFTCASGEEAVKLIPQVSPDIIILDYALSGAMTGIDVLKNIRDKGVNAKVIISTGALEAGAAQKAKDLGVEVFLNKPLLMQTLDEAINKLISAETK